MFTLNYLEMLDEEKLEELERRLQELRKKRKRDSGASDEQVRAKRCLQLDSPAVGTRTRSKKKDKGPDKDDKDDDKRTDNEDGKRPDNDDGKHPEKDDSKGTRLEPLRVDGPDTDIGNDAGPNNDNGKDEKCPSNYEEKYPVVDEHKVGYIWRGCIKDHAVTHLESNPHHIDKQHRLKGSQGFPELSRPPATRTGFAGVWVVPGGALGWFVHVRSTELVKVYGPWQKPRAIVYVMLSLDKARESITQALVAIDFGAPSDDEFSFCSAVLAEDTKLRRSRCALVMSTPAFSLLSPESRKRQISEWDEEVVVIC